MHYDELFCVYHARSFWTPRPLSALQFPSPQIGDIITRAAFPSAGAAAEPIIFRFPPFHLMRPPVFHQPLNPSASATASATSAHCYSRKRVLPTPPSLFHVASSSSLAAAVPITQEDSTALSALPMGGHVTTTGSGNKATATSRRIESGFCAMEDDVSSHVSPLHDVGGDAEKKSSDDDEDNDDGTDSCRHQLDDVSVDSEDRVIFTSG